MSSGNLAKALLLGVTASLPSSRGTRRPKRGSPGKRSSAKRTPVPTGIAVRLSVGCASAEFIATLWADRGAGQKSAERSPVTVRSPVCASAKGCRGWSSHHDRATMSPVNVTHPRMPQPVSQGRSRVAHFLQHQASSASGSSLPKHDTIALSGSGCCSQPAPRRCERSHRYLSGEQEARS